MTTHLPPEQTTRPEASSFGQTAQITLYGVWAVAGLALLLMWGDLWAVQRGLPVEQALVYGALAAVASLFPARLAGGRVSLVHAVGVLAFTSVSVSAFVVVGVCLGVGSLVGTSVYEMRFRRATRRVSVSYILHETLSVLSAYVLAAAFFITLGGRMPSGALDFEDWAGGLLVLVYAVVYSALTTFLFLIRWAVARQAIDRGDRIRMLSIILLPALLALLDGEIARTVNFSGQILLYISALFVLLLISDLSTAETRLRRDLLAEQAMSSENERLYREQSDYVEQLALLNQVVGALGGTLDSETLLEHLISSASILSSAKGFAIYVNEDKRVNLSLSVGMTDEFLLKAPPPVHIPKLSGASEAEPTVVEDVATDPRATVLRSLHLERTYQAIVELPMLAGGELLGILSLFYPTGVQPSARQIEILRIFATQSAQALANARQYVEAVQTYQQRAERLQTLTWLSRTLSSSVDVESMCEQVIDVALLATGAEIGTVLLLEEYTSAASLRIGAQRGLNPKGNNTLDVAIERIKSVVTPSSGSMIVYRENSDEIGLSFLSLHTQALLISPMVQGGLLFGIIWLETTSSKAFNAEDVQFVEQISHQSLIVLENARLFQRIERDRDRLATLLDTMEEGLMMVDRQGYIVIANPQIQMLGVQPQDIIGTRYADGLQHPILGLAKRTGFETLSEAEQFLADLNTADAVRPPLEYVTEGGRRIERRIVLIEDEDNVGLGAMLVFYDRTQAYALEQSREELTHMLVHDLRSPLTSVTTALKLIQSVVPSDSPAYAMVESSSEISRRAVRKILNRVNSMLDIAKMSTGKLALSTERTSIEPLIKMVINELLPIAIDTQVELMYDLGEHGTELALHIDPDKIERVLMNLMDNALKYSPSGGRITVRLHEAENAMVRVDVVDEGPGIPPEYRTKLFERFSQVEGSRPKRGGVGLGLTFCKLVVDAHGGHIWIEDNPTGGSVFAMTLPLHQPTPL